MQDHYFKYVATDGNTTYFAIREADLEEVRSNDIDMYLETHKSDPKLEKKSLEEKYPIVAQYPAKMTEDGINSDLDHMGVPGAGSVVDATFQDIITIISNSAGHVAAGRFGDLLKSGFVRNDVV